MSFVFEWDKEKAEENIAKHGIDFEEAKSVFYDYFGSTFYDELHSQIEERLVILKIIGCYLCHIPKEIITIG